MTKATKPTPEGPPTTRLLLARGRDGRLRVTGDAPAVHTVTADQFARFVSAGHVEGDRVVLDRRGGSPVRYSIAVDDETGNIVMTLEEA